MMSKHQVNSQGFSDEDGKNHVNSQGVSDDESGTKKNDFMNASHQDGPKLYQVALHPCLQPCTSQAPQGKAFDVSSKTSATDPPDACSSPHSPQPSAAVSGPAPH